MKNLTISNWHEEVNPNRIVINVNNGKKLIIKNTKPKNYQTWLQMLDLYKTNTTAKFQIDRAITQM